MSYGFTGWTNWIAKRAYGNTWRLTPNTADRCITMTGAAIETKISIKARHRLVRLELTLMSATYVKCETSILDAVLYRKQGEVEGTQYHEDIVYDNQGDMGSLNKKWFGEGYEYEDSKFTLLLNGTSTYKVTVVLYVQVEGNQIE